MTLSLAGPLLLVGAGKMGGALLECWLRQGLDGKRPIRFNDRRRRSFGRCWSARLVAPAAE